MTKHQWRESIQSIFRSHIDPENDEELKGTKTDIEDKVQKILKLIKDENGETNAEDCPNKEPLVELIEDFHQQYQSLYDRYDHLTGELRQKVHGKGYDSSSSSSSDSDSHNSPRIKSRKNGKREDKFQKLTDGFKHELETANLEIVELKSKLKVVTEEKEELNSKYHASSLKVQEADEEVKKWTAEVDILKNEKSDILKANEDLLLKVQYASEMEAQLNHKLEDLNNKISITVLEKEAAMSTIEEEKKTNDDLRAITGQLKDQKEMLQLELEALKEEACVTTDRLKSAQQEVENLIKAQKITEEENNLLSSKVAELAEEIKQAHNTIQDLVNESSQLKEKLDGRETELLKYQEMHETHMSETGTRTRDLELKLETLHQQKSETEKQKDKELSALLMKLEDRETDLLSQVQHLTGGKSMLSEEIKQLQDKIQELITESSQLKENLDEKERDFSTHKEIHESHKNEVATRIRDLELELEALHSQKHGIEKQKDDEISHLLTKIEDKEKDTERLNEDVNNLQLKVETLQSQKRELEELLEQKSDEASTQIKELMIKISEKQCELESLESQRIESEVQLEKRILEISEYLVLVESLKAELSKKSADLLKLQEEEEGHIVLAKGLHLQVDTMQNKEKEFEQQRGEQKYEIDRLIKEKEVLQDRISELEKASSEREDQFSALQLKLEEATNEASARIRDLELELEALHSQKHGIEKQKDDEISHLLTKIEDKVKDTERLNEDVNNLQLKVETLQSQKRELEELLEQKSGEASTQIKELMIKISEKQCELESLESQRIESEAQLEKRILEISEYLVLVESLKAELSKKSADLLKLQEEEEGHIVLAKGLQLQVDTMQNKEKEFEQQRGEQKYEIDRLIKEKEVLQDRIYELEKASSEREDQFSALQLKLEEATNEASARIRDSELELEALHLQKHGIEKQKDEEISHLLTKIDDKEKDTERLNEDVNNLQLKVETLQTQKSKLEELLEQKSDEASTQIKELMIKISEKQCEVESLESQRIESEVQLEKRISEISEYLMLIESLKAELSKKSADLLKLQEEEEGHIVLVKDLQLQVDTLQNKEKEFEQQLGEQKSEIDRLRKEKEVLQDRISELEKASSEREDQFSALQLKLEEATNEASAQIDASAVQINNLLQELDSLHAEKKQLESLNEKEREDSAKSLTAIEYQNIELLSKMTEQESILNQQEAAFRKLSEVHEQLEVYFKECKENLQVAERKIETMTEEFHNEIESKDRTLAELEETIEDLKRELEIKGDEFTTLTENVRNIEVKLRLSNQKLRITEQLLSEKETDHAAKEEKFQQDNKVLHERILILCGVISAYKEDQFKIKADITEKLNETFTGLDALTMKVEEDYGHIETCVYEILNELQVAKSWVRDKNDKEEYQKKEIANLIVALNDEKEQESLLRQQIEKLMMKLQMNVDEKENLTKAIKQLEVKMEESKTVINEKDEKVEELQKRLNEKNEGILGLGEEKREAIRQLCIWNDYYRERYIHLQEMLTSRTGGRRQITA